MFFLFRDGYIEVGEDAGPEMHITHPHLLVHIA